MAKRNGSAAKPLTHNDDPILGICQVAKMFGRHRNTITGWIDDGLLPVVTMPGGTRGVRQSVVAKFLGVIQETHEASA